MMLVDSILNIGVSLIERFFPNKEEQERRKADLLKMQMEGELKQIEQDFQLNLNQLEINKEEAKSASLFVSGWRPFVGWMGGIGLGYSVFLFPVVQWACTIWYPTITPPVLDVSVVVSVLGGMLGINTISRSVDKVKGVASTALKK